MCTEPWHSILLFYSDLTCNKTYIDNYTIYNKNTRVEITGCFKVLEYRKLQDFEKDIVSQCQSEINQYPILKLGISLPVVNCVIRIQ